MAKCGYCGSTIFLGGVTAGGQRFCNRTCYQNAFVLSVTKNIPADQIDRRVEEVWRGNCPVCNQLGPVDVHRFHQVWSVLILTRWTSASRVSCKACGVKRQLGAVAFSFSLGWWGIPWGLILTPVQISRNLAGIAGKAGRDQPSDNLRKLVIINIGTQLLAKQKLANQQAASTPPPLPPQ